MILQGSRPAAVPGHPRHGFDTGRSFLAARLNQLCPPEAVSKPLTRTRETVVGSDHQGPEVTPTRPDSTSLAPPEDG